MVLRLRQWLTAAALGLALVALPSLPSQAQPAPDASAEVMNAQLAAAQVARVGPSYLYPDHAVAPGLVNPDITQANIHQTICSPTWSTKTIRPPATYTTHLKQLQLTAGHATDRNPTHYEEDHFISLELGGHPRDPRNLWPERWAPPRSRSRAAGRSRRTSSAPRARTPWRMRSTGRSSPAP
jgi:hypothetical protein